MIAEEERHLKELEKEKKSLLARMQELDAFQDKVNEMMTLLGEAGYAAEDPQILAGLCDRGRFSAVEKELAVERLKMWWKQATTRWYRSWEASTRNYPGWKTVWKNR